MREKAWIRIINKKQVKKKGYFKKAATLQKSTQTLPKTTKNH